MYISYFQIGWRNLLRTKTHSFINIAGLAVGIASCFMISLYIRDELSYDRYHKYADRIHRIVMPEWAKTPGALAPGLMSTAPHVIEEAVRLWPLFSPAKIRYQDLVFVENNVVFADPAVFSVFTWPLLQGNPEKALVARNSIVLTKSMAQKYFGNKDPIGAQLKFWGNDLTVTGVMADVPHNSHLQFDFLVSFSTLSLVMGDNIDENWSMPVFYTYFLAKPGAPFQNLEKTIQGIFESRLPDANQTVSLQPVARIHLHSDLNGEFRAGGNTSYLYVIGTAALLILLLASINFTNLNAARATTRTREVGMRKVLGAVKVQLVEQFFGEALITSVIAVLLSIVLVSLAMPAFNDFSGKSIQLNEALDAEFLGAGIGLVLLTGFFAGAYPALFLARQKPISSLRSTGGPRSSGFVFRKALIIFQFIVSTFFLTGMIVVLLQLNYLQSKDLGFDKNQIIVLDGDGFTQLKTELQNISGVEQVAGVPQVLPARLPMSSFRAEANVADSTSQMSYYGVTPGFLRTMGIRMIAGSDFSENSKVDEEEAFILNKSAVRQLGWTPEEALGKPFSMSVPPLNGGSESWRNGYITGVVADFHHETLYQTVKPIVLYPSNDLNLTLVRTKTDPDIISSIQKAWTKVNPDAPFNYYFLDDRIRQHYQSETKLGALIAAATVLAVIIACLGLLGLISFSASRRTKEIGIRKVVGASGVQIVALLSRDLIKLVAIAILLSLPLTYYALDQWLNHFAYHIELHWIIFAFASLLTMFVALLTVTLESLKAAMTQPTDSLRME